MYQLNKHFHTNHNQMHQYMFCNLYTYMLEMEMLEELVMGLVMVMELELEMVMELELVMGMQDIDHLPKPKLHK